MPKTETVAPEGKKEGSENGKPRLLSEANIEARERIYANAGRGEAPPAEPPKAPASKDFKPVPTPDSGQPTAGAPVKSAPAAQQPPEPEQPVPAAREKKEDRTVPLEALHEAREREKSLKRENTELQEQVRVLLKDLKEFSAKPPAEAAPIEALDYDKALTALQDEVKELRARDQKREQTTEEERGRQARAKTEADVKQTALDLEKEGFPGFDRFIPMIGAELQKLHAVDPDEARRLDNPDGWKKIFKENIHPLVSGFGQKKASEDRTKEKEALKEGAGLLMPGGAPPAPPAEKEDDYSFEQYMKERARRSAQPQPRR